MSREGQAGADELSALMRGAQAGDEAAYADLLTRITPMLRRAIRARRRFLPPQDIEDLVQDTLLSLHAVRATFDPARPFLPWVSAIMHNRMADAARRHARRTVNEVAVETYPDDAATAEPDPRLDYGAPQALRAAIEALPAGQRAAIQLLKIKELSLREAAAQTNMSVSALKVAVHRGIKTLRATLRRD